MPTLSPVPVPADFSPARLLLGSVAGSELRRDTCPVLTIRVPALRATPSAPPV